jgi:hypothetical protein
MILPVLLAAAAFGAESSSSWGQELVDFQRALHSKSLGYLDLGQIQALDPDVSVDHPTLGRLDGFVEVRRVAGVVMGPDSASSIRGGLEGSWEQGGWTPDLYLSSPPDPHISRRSWSLGACAGWVEPQVFAMGGVHHADRASWTGNAPADLEDAELDGWGLLRWHRAGIMGSVDRSGPGVVRGALLSDPSPIGQARPWLWPQLEGSVSWERAAWNRWSDHDALAGSVRVPLLRERVSARLEAGSDGFRLLQASSDIDPQGLVGIDLSWWRRGGSDLAGIRLRIPVLTLSLNDPDDVDEFHSRGALVWAMRFRIGWEDSQTWYAPGRRPATFEERR